MFKSTSSGIVEGDDAISCVRSRLELSSATVAFYLRVPKKQCHGVSDVVDTKLEERVR